MVVSSMTIIQATARIDEEGRMTQPRLLQWTLSKATTTVFSASNPTKSGSRKVALYDHGTENT